MNSLLLSSARFCCPGLLPPVVLPSLCCCLALLLYSGSWWCLLLLFIHILSLIKRDDTKSSFIVVYLFFGVCFIFLFVRWDHHWERKMKPYMNSRNSFVIKLLLLTFYCTFYFSDLWSQIIELTPNWSSSMFQKLQ